MTLIVAFAVGLTADGVANTLAAQEAPDSASVVPEVDTTPLPAAAAITVADVPSDDGGALAVTWTLPETVTLDSVVVRRRFADGREEVVARLPGVATRWVDGGAGHEPVSYIVEVGAGERRTASAPSATMRSKRNWFRPARLNQLFILSALFGAIGYFTYHASRGRQFYIRRIAGLEAVEEAVGRATEMGRSVLFIPGINDLDDVQTLAGLTILSQIAGKVAQYESKLDVPVARSLVMSTGRETVREAFLAAGRPDLYTDDLVHYITDEQFGYVAAVDGYMVREKPAACFYLGAFYAESLVLAETGNSIGAIQVAGTAMPTQLPFFVAACDYTLIGEELFAASAYLSKDARTIGSLRGQDIGKLIAMTGIVVGVVAVLARMGSATQWIRWLFTVN
jgi:hypothetical protein